MRKKISLILLLLISCGAGCRIVWMNYRYSSPEVWTGRMHDSLQVGNYVITFSDWQWGDGSLLQELCPGFCLITVEDETEKGTFREYPADRERVGLVTLRIEKTEEDESILDLTGIAFESGAWGNQFDMELMHLLNPQLEGLRIQMEKGEYREIIFPMTMLDLQFGERAWEGIDRRDFYMVLEYYPWKLQFCCGQESSF